MRIHHIGYLVKNMDVSLKLFYDLGFVDKSNKQYDQARDIYITFLENHQYVVELIQPVSNTSKFASFIKRFGNLPYHLCYETEDMNKDIEYFQACGYYPIQKPEVAPCIDGRRVAFLQNPDIGIIELVER